MKIKAVLFDLDGTLLPMDLNEFTKVYFQELSKKLYPLGYTDTKLLVSTILHGIDAVEHNDGSQVNEDVFWEKFCSVYKDDLMTMKANLDDFYDNEFENVKGICRTEPKAFETVCRMKELGLRMAIATKPIFPKKAVLSRLKWAGLEPDDFEYITSYEICKYCKPDVNYYRETAERMGLLPEECLMVGNDVVEDMAAEKAGMKVFLLTDYLENGEGKDISRYASGSFDAVVEYVASNLKL